ncbi:MAG: flagellar FliJ family protein [Archangium sp.]|nr:flagellar FliJ family protein [Archangium sp.]
MIRTRLDVVVKVKERAEEKAGQALANAERAVRSAQERLEVAKARTSQDSRARADVSQWAVQELAHHRALLDANKAKQEVDQLKKAAETVRAHYVSANRAAEVVRRVADARRDELMKEAARNEDKQLDEAASMLWFRKAG